MDFLNRILDKNWQETLFACCYKHFLKTPFLMDFLNRILDKNGQETLF